MEYVNCDFCGGNKFLEICEQKDIIHNRTSQFFKVVECENCGLNFLNPRPTVSEIGEYYPDNYAFHENISNTKRFLSQMLDYISNSLFIYFFLWIPKRFQRYLALRIKPTLEDPILKIIKEKRNLNLLDIGCGKGLYAHFWGVKGGLINYKKYANVFGVEIEHQSSEFLRSNGVNVFNDLFSFESYAKRDNLKFDIIRMNWSLEHVHNPGAYFDFISSFLKKGGKAFINVPNYDGIIYKLAKELVEVPVHLYHFKQKDIENYSQKYNLKVLECKTSSYPGSFLFFGEVFSPVKNFSKMSLLDCLKLKKFLVTVDNLNMGNDLLVCLTQK